MEVTGADAERFLETVSPADLLSLPEGSGISSVSRVFQVMVFLKKKIEPYDVCLGL